LFLTQFSGKRQENFLLHNNKIGRADAPKMGTKFAAIPLLTLTLMPERLALE
jgi:hypothetical protein